MRDMHPNQIEQQITEPIAPEIARTVELPSFLHPLRRLGRLAELGAGLPGERAGMSFPDIAYLTRGELVREAEAYAKAEWLLGLFKPHDVDGLPHAE